MICIAEHWFIEGEKKIKLNNLQIAAEFNRCEKNGGGVASYVTSKIGYSNTDLVESLNEEGRFECCAIKITHYKNLKLKKPILLVTVYRPSNTTNNTADNYIIFFQKMEKLFHILTKSNSMFLVCVDFNVDLLNRNHPNTREFIVLCKSFNLKKNVKETYTRYKSKTLLDNCISNINIDKCNVIDSTISDHRGILVEVDLDCFESCGKMVRKYSEGKNLKFVGEVSDAFSEKLSFNEFHNKAIELYKANFPLEKKANVRKKPHLTLEEQKELSAMFRRKDLYFEFYKYFGATSYKKK